MLKATYSETNIYLELIQQPLEAWLMARIVLALRTGQRLIMEHGTASLLIAAHQPADELEIVMTWTDRDRLSVTFCDADYVEICLEGTWLTSDLNQEEGLFVAVLHPKTECLLHRLWHRSQMRSSSLWR